MLIFSPFLDLSLCFLKVPFLFLTLGFSWFWFKWRMRRLSSRSNTSCSHWASCCSRCRRNSSWDFCSRAARFSSSSRHRSSWWRAKGKWKKVFRSELISAGLVCVTEVMQIYSLMKQNSEKIGSSESYYDAWWLTAALWHFIWWVSPPGILH